MSFCVGCGTGALKNLVEKSEFYNIIFNDGKKIRKYRMKSDKAFQKFAKKIGNELECYFELVNDGVYVLKPRWCPK